MWVGPDTSSQSELHLPGNTGCFRDGRVTQSDTFCQGLMRCEDVGSRTSAAVLLPHWEGLELLKVTRCSLRIKEHSGRQNREDEKNLVLILVIQLLSETSSECRLFSDPFIV